MVYLDSRFNTLMGVSGLSGSKSKLERGKLGKSSHRASNVMVNDPPSPLSMRERGGGTRKLVST